VRRWLTVPLVVIAGASIGAQLRKPRPVRVLFIGNSYVYMNDLPVMAGALVSVRSPIAR
jgi:hypothetical protein